MQRHWLRASVRVSGCSIRLAARVLCKAASLAVSQVCTHCVASAWQLGGTSGADVFRGMHVR